MVESPRADFSHKLIAAKTEMVRWQRKYLTVKELRPYVFDLLLRSRVILGHGSFEVQAAVPGQHYNEEGAENPTCQVRVSRPFIHLDTRTSGSLRGLYLIEKLPNGTDYPLPDGTIEIVELFTPDLHKGSPEQQVQRIVQAICEAIQPEQILKKSKAAFTIYPNGQIEDFHGLFNFPQSVTLCHLALLEIEEGLSSKQ